MKYRAKFNTPWCKKGQIYAGEFCFEDRSNMPLRFGNPQDYPDLFEPVEEKSNQEKWRIFLEKFFYGIYYRMDREVEVFYSLTDSLAARLDKLGYSADKIYKEVFGEG